jgi:hypothetical protein
VKEPGLRQRLGAIGLQDQVSEFLLFAYKRLLPFLSGEPTGDVQVDLPLVATQIEHLKSAERLVLRLPFSLYLDQALARRMHGELADIRDDPLTAKFLGDGSGCTASTEEIGDEIAFITT